MRAARVSELQYNKKSCVAATHHVDYIAATQLFIFGDGFENLWPRAPYGALAIGYYSKRCSAATSLKKPVSYSAAAASETPTTPHILCGRAERAPLLLYIMTQLLREGARQPNRPSAQPPVSPIARLPRLKRR